MVEISNKTKMAIVCDFVSPTKIRHFIGLPPENDFETDTRKQLDPAAFLLMETRDEGIFLFRFDRNGDGVGDTWHATLDDALHQAAFEYKLKSEDWTDIPDECEDPIGLGVHTIKQRKD